ncbi:UPF0149 family protein [Labrys monachus]|uniref:YecA family protein n=1 Tax=Labrys monachus TaxID=217067 RepID=A0ABU0F6I7_9HYPH|nr:UPF0149 family protein [Labrys monachus]MDQ0390234.1 uncharacterized protein [Labrys monachus]
MAVFFPDLERLDEALMALDDDVLMLSQLDGFLTGVLLCPEPVLPSEWLPVVWGRSEENEEPVFTSEAQAREVLDLIMRYYNHVAEILDSPSRRCEPMLMEDPRTDEVLWEIWMEGFELALMLRPELYGTVYGNGRPEVAGAYRGLMELIEISSDKSTLPPKKIERLTLAAHDAIGPYVDRLNAARRGEAAPPAPFAAAAGRVGRNDPCPCGSGRKYKKCCGMN